MKNQWKSLLLLATALCVVLGYALCRNEIRFDVRLKKANLAKAFEPRHTDASVEAGLAASAKAREDSIRAAREHPDTTRQRILFFGDFRHFFRHDVPRVVRVVKAFKVSRHGKRACLAFSPAA